MGRDRELKWLAFCLYPLSFFLYSPFNTFFRGFCTKVTCTFPPQENKYELSELQYLPHYWSNKGFKSTVVNQVFIFTLRVTWNYAHSPFPKKNPKKPHELTQLYWRKICIKGSDRLCKVIWTKYAVLSKTSLGFIWDIFHFLKICESWVWAQIRRSKLLIWGWIRFQN